MNPENSQKEEMMLQRLNSIWCRYFTDHDAVDLCNHLVFVFHLWDDLIDKDKERTAGDINRALTTLAAIIPLNPFYQRHVRELAPVMMNLVMKWQNANELEKRKGDDELFIAYMLREGYADIFGYCLLLDRGYAWMAVNGEDFWADLGTGMWRDFGEYLEEMQ